MRIVDNKVREIIQEPGMDGVYKIIREVTSVCYQTDPYKSNRTPKEFVDDVIIPNAHTRALEFGTIYLVVPCPINEVDDNKEKTMLRKVISNHYSRHISKVECNSESNPSSEPKQVNYITTNLRVIMQGFYSTDEEAAKHGYDDNFLILLKYMTEARPLHKKRRTFTMDISRGCSDDNRTHVAFSSMAESSRWCNFAKGRFGSQITFIRPYWFGKNRIADNCFKIGMWLEEKVYITLSRVFNLQAQQLKRVFPLGAKTELVLCGYDDAWQNFFWRRCDKHADPECVKVANMIKEIYNSNKQ